jgi:hypothetical protein
MRIPIHPGSIAALLLAVVLAGGGWTVTSRTQTVASTPQLGPGARVALERCLEQVATIQDLYWAAACMQTADDSADCSLPLEKARRLNEERAIEDQRCMTEAAEVQGVAGSPALHR